MADKSDFTVLSVVAIVAIVALVVMIVGTPSELQNNVQVPSFVQDIDTSGQAMKSSTYSFSALYEYGIRIDKGYMGYFYAPQTGNDKGVVSIPVKTKKGNPIEITWGFDLVDQLAPVAPSIATGLAMADITGAAVYACPSTQTIPKGFTFVQDTGGPGHEASVQWDVDAQGKKSLDGVPEQTVRDKCGSTGSYPARVVSGSTGAYGAGVALTPEMKKCLGGAGVDVNTLYGQVYEFLSNCQQGSVMVNNLITRHTVTNSPLCEGESCEGDSTTCQTGKTPLTYGHEALGIVTQGKPYCKVTVKGACEITCDVITREEPLDK